MVFYTARSLTNANITKTLNKAVSDNTVAVINVSLGECESALAEKLLDDVYEIAKEV